MTEEDGISRRNAIAFGLTGIAVASCSGKSETKAADTTVSITGIWPSVGDDPNKKDGDLSIQSKFKPKHVTLVRVTSGKGWEISSSHASFELGEVSDQDRVDFAINTFDRFNNDQLPLKKIKRFKDLVSDAGTKIKRRTGHDGHGNGHNNDYEATDFDDFRFGKQHEIFIWFDGKDVDFHKDKAGNELYIAIGPLLSTGESGSLNRSFYARRIEATGRLDGPVMAIRNYHYDGFGQPVTGTAAERPFAMSIYFTVLSNSGKRMLLLLDPDTGNGVGYDP